MSQLYQENGNQKYASSAYDVVLNTMDLNGIVFKGDDFLPIQAFTHVSFKDDPIFTGASQSLRDKLEHFNYEKLEYLGDVIINLSVIK